MQEYEFLYKPGDLHTAPQYVGTLVNLITNKSRGNYTMYCLSMYIAPHQPRLDWQMWFAALGSYQNNPWLVHLIYRLLIGQKEGELGQNAFISELSSISDTSAIMCDLFKEDVSSCFNN